MKANEYKVMDLTLLLDTTLDVTNHLTAVEHHFHGAQLLSHERRKKKRVLWQTDQFTMLSISFQDRHFGVC